MSDLYADTDIWPEPPTTPEAGQNGTLPAEQAPQVPVEGLPNHWIELKIEEMDVRHEGPDGPCSHVMTRYVSEWVEESSTHKEEKP